MYSNNDKVPQINKKAEKHCLKSSVNSRRTLAYQEVTLRICPLGKLSHFETTAEFYFVYIPSISLVSEPILSITSWFAKVLYGYFFRLHNGVQFITLIPGHFCHGRKFVSGRSIRGSLRLTLRFVFILSIRVRP